ncbi:MAG: glutamyl-tRNA reductase [Bacteroidota bacterium]
MHNSFRALSLSYKNAPVDVRECVSFDPNQTSDILMKMREVFGLEEILLISTCNRTEVYYTNSENISREIIKLLATYKGLKADQLTNYFTLFEGEKAVSQLFRVSLGLEAKVVGDLQITSQIKNAYQASADLELAGPFLHRLLHTIFFSNKRVVQETAFRDGAASVSYAAKELIEDLTKEVVDPKILLIGVGEIGEAAAKNLADSGFNGVTVINRTKIKAQELAADCGFKWMDYDQLNEAIENHDLIITSLGSEQPIIDKRLLETMNLLTFKYFIDLSVPRAVNPDVEELPGVVVYNVDDIQSKANEALDKRMASIPAVEEIVESGIHDFGNWSKEMEVSPTIQKLKGALETIRKEEISRYIKDLDDDEEKKIELITKNIMQKIIKLPVLQLKAACKRGEADTLIDVLSDLFDLERTPQKK